MASSDKVLVTGGTGFLAAHITLQLLQKGYSVKTTVRALAGKDKVIQTLKGAGVTMLDNLSFAEAELTKDGGWAEAMQGCKYVLSVVSPVFFEVPKDEADAIRPAVEGILRILKFAKGAGVKRVVMTSSFGVAGFSQTDKTRQTTEADWTDPALKGLSAYEKSKGLAERAAWDFIKGEGCGLEFATINPVAILGPALSAHVSGSFDILKHLLDGSLKAAPPIALNIVDVRDVADLHIRAMESDAADGQRFIATADGQISMPEIAALLKKTAPQVAAKVTSKTVPAFVVRLAALLNAQAKQGAIFLKVNRNVSNEKARKVLGWKPLATAEQAILACLESMVKHGIVK